MLDSNEITLWSHDLVHLCEIIIIIIFSVLLKVFVSSYVEF